MKKKSVLPKPIPDEARILAFRNIALNTGLPPKVRGYALNALSKMGMKGLDPLVEFIQKTESNDDMREFACRLVDKMRQRGASRER